MARAIASDFKRDAKLTRTEHGCAKPPRRTRRSTSALLLQLQRSENRWLAMKKTGPSHPARAHGRCGKYLRRKHRAHTMSTREAPTPLTRRWRFKMPATFTRGAVVSLA